ncbi:SpvB/TcaC N-terminal domain-containing protein, partial [Methanococcus maripaludis]
YLDGSSYELIYVESNDSYHTEIESFAKIEKELTVTNTYGEYWIVKMPDGTEYRFGYNTDSEAVNSVSTRNYVSKWWLDKIEDVNGNQIIYNYLENPTTGEVGSTYLKNITYNDGFSSVEFGFITKPYTFSLYTYGNKIIEKSLISNVTIKNNGTLVWSYDIQYQNEDSNTFLGSITKSSADESFPATEFEYSATDGWVQDTSWNPPCYFTAGGYDQGTRLADVNGDGLVDIIQGLYSSGAYRNAWINTGNGWVQDTSWNPPCYFTAGGYDQGTRLADVNGDGL